MTRTWSRAPRVHMPRLSAERGERADVKPLELYFDLVFVLGFTQCTALMASQSTLGGTRSGHARARTVVVGVGRLCVAHERDRPRGGRRPARDVRGHGGTARGRALRARGLRGSWPHVRNRLRGGPRRPHRPVPARQPHRSPAPPRSRPLGDRLGDRRRARGRRSLPRRRRPRGAVGRRHPHRLGRTGPLRAGGCFPPTSPNATTS